MRSYCACNSQPKHFLSIQQNDGHCHSVWKCSILCPNIFGEIFTIDELNFTSKRYKILLKPCHGHQKLIRCTSYICLPNQRTSKSDSCFVTRMTSFQCLDNCLVTNNGTMILLGPLCWKKGSRTSCDSRSRINESAIFSSILNVCAIADIIHLWRLVTRTLLKRVGEDILFDKIGRLFPFAFSQVCLFLFEDPSGGQVRFTGNSTRQVSYHQFKRRGRSKRMDKRALTLRLCVPTRYAEPPRRHA